MLVLAELYNVCCVHVAVMCVQQSSKQHAGPECTNNLHDTSRCNRSRLAMNSSSINLFFLLLLLLLVACRLAVHWSNQVQTEHVYCCSAAEICLLRSVSDCPSAVASLYIYHVLIVCDQCASGAAVCIAGAISAADAAIGSARCLEGASGSYCHQQEDNPALSSADTCELPNAWACMLMLCLITVLVFRRSDFLCLIVGWYAEAHLVISQCTSVICVQCACCAAHYMQPSMCLLHAVF